MIRRYLFVCGKNRRRSPTAEQLFADIEGIDTLSAGVRRDSDERLTKDLVLWADAIFVMDKRQQNFVRAQFQSELAGKQVVNLNIPDRYEMMDKALIEIFRSKMQRYLP